MGLELSCRECGAANSAVALFCMACGESLSRSCPSCGADTPPGSRFCIACGSEVASDSSGDAGGDPRLAAGLTGLPGVPAEQRRTVTILFADLSGYTSVAERLDHEAVKSLIDRCLTRLAQEVERFGGRVDKFIGDNVMAVFGAPVAHEQDPERAVRAALGMQAAMAELNGELLSEHGFEFALRVGVNTGEVLAGRVGDAYTVIGDAVNVASRLEASASPGTITVGERTWRATHGVVAYEPLERLELKGKGEPVAAWRALAASPQPSRVREPRRETALVGRDDELASLERSLGRVGSAQSPHLFTLVGEAGVGKTRLVREFERLLAERRPPVPIRKGRCLPFGASIVYWPLSEMIRADCAITDDDSAEIASEKLTARLTPLLAAGGDHAAVARRIAPLARLLDVEAADADGRDERDDPQNARDSLFGAVRAYLEALTEHEPLVLVWEDIHWADEGMLDLIEYLSHWMRTPTLQLCLAREELLERRPTWGASRRTASSLFLDPLALGPTRELIDSLLRDASLDPEMLAGLADRAGGNPLFAEELVQRLTEDGGTKAAELPDTMQGLLAARLDSLAPLEAKLVAHAAVVGQIFWEGTLDPVARAEGGDLRSALATLRQKDIIVPSEGGRLAGEQELAFKHVLIREVAYAMLPKAVRALKHFEIGRFIEGRAGERRHEVVALLAEHYGRAAALGEEVHLPPEELAPLRAKALQYLEAAGDAAGALHSNQEALAHYEAAAALGIGDPELQARIGEKRGDLSLRLGRVDGAVEVWRQALEHHERHEELEHVAELHRKIGAALAHKGERTQAIEHHQKGINLIKDAPPSLALVRLYEEAAWLYMQVGDNMLAIYASEKALRLAERLGEMRAASRAHGIFGRVFGRIGDTVKARENLARAIELAQGSDEHEAVLAMLALGHHLEYAEGDYSAAESSYGEALKLAERLGDIPAQIELHAAIAQLAFYRCDWELVERESDLSAELAEREGLVGKLCLANTLRGRMRWRAGEWDASARLFTLAYELAEQLGWSEAAFGALLGLAVTLRDRGELAAAEAALSEALAVCERAGLLSDSIQAHASIALACTLAGRAEPAAAAAEQASALAERLHYPVGVAAALEARGIVGEPPESVEALAEARTVWMRLGRPLDVARCEMLIGLELRGIDPAGSEEALARASAAYEQLGVMHRAEQSRQLIAAGAAHG
ncbi:MAG TPA: adenylate/guanylate cyclase domain-containing protein [Solirubrobacteraceae bacterium]|jgi:class 3 adenylate cyclase/predicted ATPase|nr:adenylate/guanylate cyclase domain-containing protein [Solirubrobacteraceae bacterium]